MSHHSNSEEQLEEIKEFLAKTWKIIVAIIAIGLFAIWGWRYWQSHQKQLSVDASDRYQQLITELDNNGDPQSADALVKFADETDTIYSVFANLKAAQFYVEESKDYAKAEELLIAASKETGSESVLATINLRLARIQMQLEKYSNALTTVNKVKNESWAATANDLKGDILVKMDQIQNAIDAYQTALLAKPTVELEKNIKIKLNQAEYLRNQIEPTDNKADGTETTSSDENTVQE